MKPYWTWKTKHIHWFAKIPSTVSNLHISLHPGLVSNFSNKKRHFFTPFAVQKDFQGAGAVRAAAQSSEVHKLRWNETSVDDRISATKNIGAPKSYTWYDMMWCDVMWYDVIWYDMMWCDMICTYHYISYHETEALFHPHEREVLSLSPEAVSGWISCLSAYGPFGWCNPPKTRSKAKKQVKYQHSNPITWKRWTKTRPNSKCCICTDPPPPLFFVDCHLPPPPQEYNLGKKNIPPLIFSMI